MTRSGNYRISRRRVLGAALTACGLPNVRQAMGWQQPPAVTGAVRLKLSKRLDWCFYRAGSSELGKLCVCLTHLRSGKMTIGAKDGRRFITREPNPLSLAVFEIGSWKEIYRSPLPGDNAYFSFFLGGQALYGSTSTYEPLTKHQMVTDLRNGTTEEQVHAYDPENATMYYPLSGRTLIGFRNDRELLQVHWPDMKEVLRVDAGGEVRGFSFTADRKTLIHVVGQKLVCRSASDFSPLWTREIDKDFDLTERMPWHPPSYGPHIASAYYSISADGGTAILAPGRAPYRGTPARYYLEILEGASGRPIARWPVSHKDNIAISADGKMLAIAETSGGDKHGTVQSIVRLYDVPSGAPLASLVHDLVPWKHRVNARVEIDFTADGKYLITSAYTNVKIWSVERVG